MGKPLMIQAQDDKKIEYLKKKLGIHTKIGTVRAGLRLLEKEVDRQERLQQWKRAVRLSRKQSAEVNQEFQRYSRLKRI